MRLSLRFLLYFLWKHSVKQLSIQYYVHNVFKQNKETICDLPVYLISGILSFYMHIYNEHNKSFKKPYLRYSFYLKRKKPIFHWRRNEKEAGTWEIGTWKWERGWWSDMCGVICCPDVYSELCERVKRIESRILRHEFGEEWSE